MALLSALGFSWMGLSAQADAAAADGKTFKWKMVMAWPPKFPVVDEAITRMIKNIETMSQGRLKIEHHPGGTLIPPMATWLPAQVFK